jgi:hypothetical protein
MAEETDIEALRRAVTDLAVSVRETNETTRTLVEAARGQISSSNATTIHAGGVTNAVAVCIAACSVVMFIVFASAMTWLYSQEKGAREAWSDVYMRESAQMRSEWKQFKQENGNARQ